MNEAYRRHVARALAALVLAAGSLTPAAGSITSGGESSDDFRRLLGFDVIKIYPPDAQGGAFGTSVAFAGDQLLVGAPERSVLGVVDVFELMDGDWIHVQTLEAPAGVDGFGDEIVVDGSLALIGPNQYAEQIVSVFERIGDTWLEQATLTPSQTERAFGQVLALSGDVAVVGAGGAIGAAYAFEFDGALWTETARLTPEAEDEVEFGSAVATDGTTIFVGAPETDAPNQTHGVVYLYERDGAGNWVAAGELAADKVSNGDEFGRALWVDGDRLAVGAEGSYLGGADSASYLFERSGPGQPWEQVAELTPLEPDWGSFATYERLSGDALLVGSREDGGLLYLRDTDGLWGFSERLIAPDGGTLGQGFSIGSDRIAIGDPLDSDVGHNAGAVYLFTGPVGCQGCDHLGIEVTIDACPGPLSFEVRGSTPFAPVELYMGTDRGPAPVVGGLCDGTDLGLEQSILLDTFVSDAQGTVVGAVDVLAVACGKLVQALDLDACLTSEVVWTEVTHETVKLTASDGSDRDEFGSTVALSGDRLVVGASGVSVGAFDYVGVAYVFDRQDDGSWLETARLEPQGAEGGENYKRVAVDGNVVALAGDEPTHVFELDPLSGEWSETAQLAPPGFSQGHWTTVAISGNTLVLGDERFDVDGVSSAGAVAVFERDAAGDWQPVTRLEPENPTHLGHFGDCVDIDGRTIIVGACQDAGDHAVLYVFEKGPLGNWFRAQRLAPSFQANDPIHRTCTLEGDTAARANGRQQGERQIVVFDREPGTPGPWSESYAIQQGSGAIALSHGFLATGRYSVFFRPGGTPTAPWIEFSKLDVSDAQYSTINHGMVAIEGPVIAVGSDLDSDLGDYAGAVYLFDARMPGGSWQEEQDE